MHQIGMPDGSAFSDFRQEQDAPRGRSTREARCLQPKAAKFPKMQPSAANIMPPCDPRRDDNGVGDHSRKIHCSMMISFEQLCVAANFCQDRVLFFLHDFSDCLCVGSFCTGTRRFAICVFPIAAGYHDNTISSIGRATKLKERLILTKKLSCRRDDEVIPTTGGESVHRAAEAAAKGESGPG